MAKRFPQTTDPGEIRNPVKAAALMSCLPKPHLPYKAIRRADGVRCVFFHPTQEFLRDSKSYDTSDLPVAIKRYVFVHSRLMGLREDSSDVSELIRAVQS